MKFILEREDLSKVYEYVPGTDVEIFMFQSEAKEIAKKVCSTVEFLDTDGKVFQINCFFFHEEEQ